MYTLVFKCYYPTMLADNDITELNKMAGPVRELILKMCNRAKASHIGSAFSVVDLLICIYAYVSKDNLNKVILSKGHSASAFYAVLAKFGKISEKSLDNYCADGENLAGHISHLVHSDINLSTGSLGHGLPYGASADGSSAPFATAFRLFLRKMAELGISQQLGRDPLVNI